MPESRSTRETVAGAGERALKEEREEEEERRPEPVPAGWILETER